jgi:hypothetical protein
MGKGLMSMSFTVIIKDDIHLEEQIPQLQSNIIKLSGTQLETLLKQSPPNGHTPVDEGHLAGAWTKKESQERIVMTNSAEYAVYVNEGTGVYGPRSRRITPVNAKVLHWEKGGTQYFAKSVKGIKGKHFVEAAVKDMEGKLPNILQQAVNKL